MREDGSVKIASYINNLHPTKHKQLYVTIGKIFEKFVPLFEKVLVRNSNTRCGNRLDINIHSYASEMMVSSIHLFVDPLLYVHTVFFLSIRKK